MTTAFGPIHPVANPATPTCAAEPAKDGFRRTLHLVDIENLCRTGRPAETQVADVARRYQRAVVLGETDLSLLGVGTDPRTRFAVTVAWPGGRVHCRPGPDGADIALLEAVAGEPDIVTRFDHLVIGSGDHAFSHLARYYRHAGVYVTVVANCGSVSVALASEAARVVDLPEQDEEPEQDKESE